MRPDSDIDLLVELLPNAEVGLLEHAGLMLDLNGSLGERLTLYRRTA
jgi:predicted nucleotidyltransferase